MKLFSNLLFVLLCVACCACSKKEASGQPGAQSLFDSIPASIRLVPQLKEVSGIAGSTTAPQHLWAEEDSGNPPQLWLIRYDGTVQKKVYLKGAVNRDWEDLQLAGNDLYIGDIGDNNKVFTAYTIYKFAEPAAIIDTVADFETIRFTYPDGAHDAEAFLVDPATKDIFIITKRDNPSVIYKIAFPYATAGVNTAVKTGALAYGGVVSAALSPDAKEIIVKTYTALYQYKRNGQTLDATLQTSPATLAYTQEAQGEAVMFATDNSGFFTLSEKGLADSVKLYFYKRR